MPEKKKNTPIKNAPRHLEGTMRGQINLVNHTQHFEAAITYPETDKKNQRIKNSKSIRSFNPSDFMRSIIVAMKESILRKEGNDDFKMYYGDDIIIAVFSEGTRPSVVYFRKASAPQNENQALIYAAQVIEDWFLSCYGLRVECNISDNTLQLILARTPKGYLPNTGTLVYNFLYNSTTDLTHKICSCIERYTLPEDNMEGVLYPELDAFIGIPTEIKLDTFGEIDEE